MENKKEKVAIVGAGTVGLYLAWKLSKLGHKVAVFEKNQKIENKTCSGLISERLRNFIPLDDSFAEHRIDSCLIHFPKKTIALNFKLNFLTIDRQKLNEKITELARKAGSEIIFGKPINEIPSGFDPHTITKTNFIKQDASNSSSLFGVGVNKIIGCDGALSKIREKLSLPQSRLQLGIQVVLPQPNSSKYVETWPVKNGFCWKIPRGKRTEYGALGSLNSVKKDFENFCQKQKIDFDQSELKSALIPQGLILPKDKNITLCGDAAGLTKPWSGGGVIWGLTAADILIKNFPNFEKYCKETKRFFGPKIFWGSFSNSLVYFFGNNLPFLIPSKNSVDNDFLFS